MHSRVFLFFALIVFLFATSCNKENDKEVLQRLIELDAEIDMHPQQVSDSMKRLDVNHLSRSNRAYYGLLKVISDDKTYVKFTSDSLINAVSDYYRLHDRRNSNYIRALAYQGIVRTRMGIKDSTVFEPLKEADRLLYTLNPPDPSLGYLINYFLGNIHYNNRSYSTANEYFQKTLNFAREEKDSIHLFDTYLALYWNEMQQKEFDKGKLYLDSLSSFYTKIPKKEYFILNAQSIYYDIINEPEKALEREMEKLLLYNKQDEFIDISRVYFNISNIYAGLDQLDSAMYHAQMAISLIEDTTYRQNHLYFQNIANIAEKQSNFELANSYRKKAAEYYKNSVNERLNTQIAELEKRYDLTEAENETLRAKQQSFRIIIGALLLVIVLIIVSMYAWRARKISRMKLQQAEITLQQQLLQANILKEEAGKRKWLLQLYSHISDKLTSLHGEVEALSQRYITSQPKVYKEMEKIVKNTDTALRDITKMLATDDETFYAYTHLSDKEGIFNANEKILLMLLACDADNRQLATFMNTTVESIRVRKSQLKKKMIEKGYNTSIFPE
jgi:tetratricopeptide (TPR) repeat protein